MYAYIHTYTYYDYTLLHIYHLRGRRIVLRIRLLHPAAVRCDMVLHQASRARHVRKTGIGGEV